MTQIAQLSNGFAVAGQLGAEDMAALTALGFRSVINNRPDGEGNGAYPSAAQAAALAAAAGIDYAHLPVSGLDLTDDEKVEAFEALLAALPGPVLAYCKSGTRSAMLWALAAAREQPVDQILESTAEAGFDLSVIRPDLLDRAQQVAPAPHLSAESMTWQRSGLEVCRPAG